MDPEWRSRFPLARSDHVITCVPPLGASRPTNRGDIEENDSADRPSIHQWQVFQEASNRPFFTICCLWPVLTDPQFIACCLLPVVTDPVVYYLLPFLTICCLLPVVTDP